LSVREVDTTQGPARVHLHQPAGGPEAALLLGHGAGGGVETKDLTAATEVATALGFVVGLVEQPYRVAGKKSSPKPERLDQAWIATVEALAADELDGLPLVSGGRSAGARVACRTAAETGAAAVLCLAFPVHPPGKPEKSRLDELEAVEVPVLVVQGERDQFGMPPPGKGREVVKVPGNHGFSADMEPLSAAIREWLPGVKR
jgi:predicted alpha/beta-hydrolase family hydrolase